MGCKDKIANPNKDLAIEAFSDWKTSQWSLKSFEIRTSIALMCRADNDSSTADYRTRSYYRAEKPFVWIDRKGLDNRADTLVATLKTVSRMGFTERSFCVSEIEDDIQRMRNLDFDDDANTANRVAARLEYRLTKAFLRYVIGQRFGYTNPLYVFNHLDALDTDTTGRALSYRRLFDVDILRPDSAFLATALVAAHDGARLGQFLRESRPNNRAYYQLEDMLQTAHSQRERRLLMCNMERYRWREREPQDTTKGKYVVVNIPAYHLYAHGGDSLVEMRVGCGNVKTKTPLLVSAINRMDVNPVWNIPMSIIRKDVAHHAGNTAYFDRNNYYIVERKSGRRLQPTEVTSQMLMSGAYRVSQNGGEGNSLGRIIFRFPNNFSVFLHDTSNRGVFSRDNRGVSHGCVRVAEPFTLATFLMDNPSDWLLDKLRISMGMEPQTERGQRYMENAPDNPRLVSSLPVKSRVPIYIAYYTIYPDSTGRLRSWPDVYGYDEVISRAIKPFMK